MVIAQFSSAGSGLGLLPNHAAKKCGAKQAFGVGHRQKILHKKIGT
jgi:hypothetical protein